LLAAVPSIIYGMFGLFVFAPLFADYIQVPVRDLMSGMPLIGFLFGGAPNGMGILSAGIVLAFMVLPFVAAVMRDVFEITPPILRESAYGLGCTTWEVVRGIVLPYTQKGVIGGIMLGLGRALGETMAALMATGHSIQIPNSIFEPGRTLTATIAAELGESPKGGEHYQALFAIGLVLFCLSFIVNLTADFLIRGRRQ
jgi:phosphate transport system permease protein